MIGFAVRYGLSSCQYFFCPPQCLQGMSDGFRAKLLPWWVYYPVGDSNRPQLDFNNPRPVFNCFVLVNVTRLE